jgi:hypothetical protein
MAEEQRIILAEQRTFLRRVEIAVQPPFERS